ncbi:MAG: hypothetical protein IJS14_11035 [Lentisphaeria bacterium]|nr:hypothetical protein [Lentisphaeria bacterium]
MEHKFRFFNIAPFSPGNEAQLAQDMIEYQQRTGNDVVLYSLSFHPEGFPARKKSMCLVESYRKLKAELEGSPVRLGVLLQSVLGHWIRPTKEIEPWTRAVNLDGDETRFCPLDPGFQEYITEYVTLLAKEKPVFVLGDDDIRSFSSKGPECFCPLHTAEFNRRAGTNFTQEQFRDAVRNSKVGDPVFNAFERLRRDTVNGVAALIRKAIDSVDPEIPAGTCMAGWEMHLHGEICKAIAGKHPPVFRMGNSQYLEQSPKDFPARVVSTQALRAGYADFPTVLDEADTFPHNLYSRSSTSFHAKLCSSIMSGLNGAKVWFVNAHRLGYPISRNYTDILAEHRGYYDALAEEAAESELEGVVVPCHRNFPHWHPTDTSERFFEKDSWAAKIFGAFGIPFRCSFDRKTDSIISLAGEGVVDRMSDEELRTVLSGRVLADGNAAIALSRRGFDALTGVHADLTPFVFSGEIDRENGQLYRLSARKSGVPLLSVKDPAAEVLVDFYDSPFGGSLEHEIVAPSAVLFRNRLGGTVCTTAYHMGVLAWDMYNETRHAWMLKMLDRVGGKKFPFAALDEQNIMMLVRRKPDGSAILAVFNLNFDPLKQISIRCAAVPQKVEILANNGVWQPAGTEFSGDVLKVAKPMACYETVILKIR